MTDRELRLAALLELVRRDPRAFADAVIAASGRSPSPHEFHRLFHDFFSACFRARKHMLVQAPPEHGKTTQIIPALIHTLAKDPRLKIGIVSKDSDLSTEHLTRVRKILLSPLCRATFGDQLPPDHQRSAAGDKGEWSKVRLYLKGQQSPAFEVYSLTGSAEGHRLDLIWLDDAVTRACLYSEAERRQVASAIFDTFANRLTDNGILLVTNNCWHKDDPIHQMAASPVYATLWVGYEDVDRMYWRITNPPPGWAGGLSGNFPLWQAIWPRERLEKKRLEPGTAWKRLFRGLAVSPEDTRFLGRERWARWKWSDLPKPGKIIAFLDPAGGKRADKGDFAAITLVLHRPDGTWDLVDCWVERASPDDQVEACFTLHEKWLRLGYGGIHRLYVEMLPKEELWVSEIFRRHLALRKSEGRVWQLAMAVQHPIGAKEGRIERLGPPITQGWLRFPDDLEDRAGGGDHWRRLVDQIEEWPFGDHDDAPDSLAGAVFAEGAGGRPVQQDAFAGLGIF